MREIVKDGVTLARHIIEEDMKPGLNFYSKDQEYVQVGVWGHYEKGRELGSHIHNCVERAINRTYEVLYVIKGSLKADIFDLEETKIETLIVKQGELLILLESGHGYSILEEDTTVLEVKNGPYLGAEIDRRRI